MSMTTGPRPLLSAGDVGVGLLVAGTAAAAPRGGHRRTFILVHGSWHSSGVWERVSHRLAAAGHVVIARDLPGRGLNAVFPQSYFQRPLDPATFAAEPSPVAGVTLEDCVASVASDVRDAVSGGSGPVILVGHSSGGFSITPVAERYPEHVGSLVYVAGQMNAAGVTPNQDIFSDENENNRLVVPYLLSDPSVTGALRFDWNTGDPDYLAALQNIFYNDVDLPMFRAAANLLTPDDPFGPFNVPTVRTAQRWGSIRRAYVRAARDIALLPALQDRWIAEADALTPANPTKVYPLDSGHSPFISQPDALAAILLDMAV